MKRGSFILVLLAVIFMPNVLFAAHTFSLDRLQLGAQMGLGFYVGPDNGRVQRVQAYDAAKLGEGDLGWPGIETFGFFAGYRYNAHWEFQLQTVRQRLYFAERVDDAARKTYYNAMWHLDAMAEYNILIYGDKMRADLGVYNVVPFVGFGWGLTMYNAEATQRSNGDGVNTKMNTMYPRVGYKMDENKKYVPADVNVAMYIPVSTGVKWRINDNVQLKGAFQYQIYMQSRSGALDSNLEGYTPAMSNGVFGYAMGSHHNFLFSLGVVVNFGTWYEDVRRTTLDY